VQNQWPAVAASGRQWPPGEKEDPELPAEPILNSQVHNLKPAMVTNNASFN